MSKVVYYTDLKIYNDKHDNKYLKKSPRKWYCFYQNIDKYTLVFDILDILVTILDVTKDAFHI